MNTNDPIKLSAISSQRWTNFNTQVQRTVRCIYHHLPTRGLPRPLQGCDAQYLGLRQCLGILLYVVSILPKMFAISVCVMFCVYKRDV